MKKQTRIYDLFWALLLIQVFLTIMTSLSQRIILPLVIFPGMSVFFLFYLRYLLGYNLKQSSSEPLFVLRRYGVGTSLNPQNPLGYKISLLLVMGVLIFLFCLNLFALLNP
ncbi:hypothetical protein [uncultured Streptococcus sp.]|uniref:hypothetical protein n=1 Tax=uncultured Streptococcus sp. TaxID=83427 RepID=UPI0028D61570|nr:hypothetical protein [uncultured Streptococcus sp.]